MFLTIDYVHAKHYFLTPDFQEVRNISFYRKIDFKEANNLGRAINDPNETSIKMVQLRQYSVSRDHNLLYSYSFLAALLRGGRCRRCTVDGIPRRCISTSKEAFSRIARNKSTCAPMKKRSSEQSQSEREEESRQEKVHQIRY